MPFTVTINFANDAMNARIRNAFASAYGYEDTILDENGGMIPNPETKAQFRDRKIKEYIQAIVRDEEKKAALTAVPEPTVYD